MPNRPDGSGRDPMAGEVDRLLRQLDTPGSRRGPTASPEPRQGGPSPPPPVTVTLPSPLGVWVRVALGGALAAAMPFWPYRTCGLALAGYFAAAAVVMLAGVWGGYASWRRRMALAHVIAIVLIFAGVALITFQVLPRVGYAAMQLPWSCPG